MEASSQTSPYPQHLYRAHLNGSGFSRPVDLSANGLYLDPLKSDYHLGTERGIIPIKEYRHLGPTNSMAQLVDDLENHLQKTRNNQNIPRTSPHFFSSPLISLSGHLAWTIHAARQRDKGSRSDRRAFFVICGTAELRANGTNFWRVEDMIAFFDSDPYFNGAHISAQSREWAEHADEYVCWEEIPDSAIVTAEMYCDLNEPYPEAYSSGHYSLLLNTFLARSWRDLIYNTHDYLNMSFTPRLEYTQMVKRFLSPLMRWVSFDADPAALLDSMVAGFRSPLIWKWSITDKCERLEEGLAWVVDEEYSKGLLCQVDGNEEQSVRLKVKANIKAMGRHMRAKYPHRLRDQNEPAWWIASVDPEMESVFQQIAGLG
jgi:hypothetical protein